MIQPTGYLHPRYAASFAEFGIARELPACGGWILERDIHGASHRDAMGLYPLFCCQDWSLLQADLEQLDGQLVSLALVTDPFGSFTEEDLKPHFDVFFRYKEHFVTDLSMPIEKIVSKGHRKNARKALRNVNVEPCLDPLECAEEWTRLYEFLVKRHQIQGMRRFSRAVFEKQLQVPGVVYFRVLHNGEIVGGDIYYLQNDVAYAHLAAFTDEGYALGAPYAVKWVSFQYFRRESQMDRSWGWSRSGPKQ